MWRYWVACLCLPVQLSDQESVKRFLPTFNFLGNLVKTVPNVVQSLVTQNGETLQQKLSQITQLCSHRCADGICFDWVEYLHKISWKKHYLEAVLREYFGVIVA